MVRRITVKFGMMTHKFTLHKSD